MNRIFAVSMRFLSAVGIFFALSGASDAHSGLVDGYGCHRASDKASYHCHQGQFVGRTFESKEDFLRQLRGGKAEQLSPKANSSQPPQPQNRVED